MSNGLQHVYAPYRGSRATAAYYLTSCLLANGRQDMGLGLPPGAHYTLLAGLPSLQKVPTPRRPAALQRR